MWIFVFQAALALGLFLFIMWWTMFSGKKKEPKDDIKQEDDKKQDTD